MPSFSRDGKYYIVKGELDPDKEYKYKFGDIPVHYFNGEDSLNVIEYLQENLKEHDVKIYSTVYNFINMRVGNIVVSWLENGNIKVVSRQIHQLEVVVI